MVVSCFLMVGCGGSASKGGTSPAPVTSAPTPEFEPTPDPVFDPVMDSEPEPELDAMPADDGFGFDDLADD
ncbi:MAG: hypothetical protein LBC70_11005 [Chitinispirillales bacterium]|nr:hypothetical protein [Chitinispirillales bacterium]